MSSQICLGPSQANGDHTWAINLNCCTVLVVFVLVWIISEDNCGNISPGGLVLCSKKVFYLTIQLLCGNDF